MKSQYSKKIKEEAKLLYEQGIPEPQIAKMLNIKRSQTINDWRAKYGWQRFDPKFDIKILSSKEEMIAFWESLGTKAISALRSAKFKSTTEALRVLKESTQFLRSIDKLFEQKDQNQDNNKSNDENKEEKIKNDVLEVLNNISNEKEEEDGEEGEFDRI